MANTMSQFTEFDYLLNAMENAAQAPDPSKEGYFEKRKAVKEYVAKLEALRPEVTAILDEREVIAIAKKVGVPKYFYDTDQGRMALARFANACAPQPQTPSEKP